VTIVINGFIYGAVAATLSAITMALKSPHAAYNAKMVSAPPIVLPFLCREPVLANHRLVFTTATGKLRQQARNNKPEPSQTVPFPVFVSLHPAAGCLQRVVSAKTITVFLVSQSISS
jgi:hypothetical protein